MYKSVPSQINIESQLGCKMRHNTKYIVIYDNSQINFTIK